MKTYIKHHFAAIITLLVLAATQAFAAETKTVLWENFSPNGALRQRLTLAIAEHQFHCRTSSLLTMILPSGAQQENTISTFTTQHQAMSLK